MLRHGFEALKSIGDLRRQLPCLLAEVKATTPNVHFGGQQELGTAVFMALGAEMAAKMAVLGCFGPTEQ